MRHIDRICHRNFRRWAQLGSSYSRLPFVRRVSRGHTVRSGHVAHRASESVEGGALMHVSSFVVSARHDNVAIRRADYIAILGIDWRCDLALSGDCWRCTAGHSGCDNECRLVDGSDDNSGRASHVRSARPRVGTGRYGKTAQRYLREPIVAMLPDELIALDNGRLKAQWAPAPHPR